MPQNRGRNRFVLSFFVLGTVLPLVLMSYGKLVASTNSQAVHELAESATNAISPWIWVIWPTWIFMLDAEHTGTIIFMLLLAAPLNGLWYALIASTLWYTGAFLKRLARYTLGQKT